ncbi:glycoside hydrolase family 55 protein [Pochonia chlamydosporia 170]|uniref:Glycoside hydrolase family 55 protein n=1 Tax=Pochonia chlamydosporia 170 TaxID=1380566 RepID=A0A179FGX7_METCM|nr:glycoside hydrolase family 55 protein [Pochonia chlamydosporia 170]OAQ64598.1 glycoside hydrolase family 55 protein [Pochonia chlamydosporia 170]
MDHTGAARGYAPHVDNPGSYPVFKTVNPGDGGAIQSAIDTAGNGNRQNQWLASQPRVVYIPPGTYTISKTINMRTDTILMGDATNPPILKAAAGFNGQTLLNGQDPSTGVSGEISFAVGLKNLVLDTTAVNAGQGFTALYWGVAQVAQLQNIKIQMPSSTNGEGHTGIKLGRGSTLGLADVRIEKGLNGIWHNGHQQALYKNIYFYQNTVGMLISGGNTITLLAPTFDTVGTGVKNTGGSPFIGIVDGKSINSGVTFDSSVYPSIVIDNLTKDTNSNIVQLPSGTALGPSSHVNNFSFGNTVGRNPIYGATNSGTTRPGGVAPGGKIPSIAAPTFANNPVSDFINVKDSKQNGGQTIKGDGSVDEAAALNKVLQYAADNKKIAYFPFGDYRVESTLLIPIGSRIVGEAWSTISGAGNFFKSSSSPKPVVQVGKPGDVGVAQIQDMRFTVADVLPGAIIIQFQAAGSNPGDVALWNSVITVGGTRGATPLTNACTNPGKECQAAFLGMHFAKGSSAYVENVWNWVADHITEGFNGGSSIAGKGGALVESTKGTWLHALGSEHWWLYQLNLRSASNVVVTLLQSETNYEQGDNTQQIPPAPWTADVQGWGDPDFSWCGGGDKRCRMGFANYINGGSDIYFYGSASWAFFSGPGYQGCAGAYQCQKYMHYIAKTPKNLQAYGLCAKDTSVALRLGDGTDIQAQNGFTGGWNPGSDIGRYTT